MKERSRAERVHKERRENKGAKAQLPEEAAKAVACTGESQKARNKIRE